MANVRSVLSKAAKKTVDTKSKKVPDVALPALTSKIKDWAKASSDLEDAKARKAAAEEEIIGQAETARIAECQRDGKFHSSVRINGVVIVSSLNKYSSIPSDELDHIQDIFGEKKTDEFFRTKTEVSLTAAALADDALLGKLIAAVGGEEKFAQFFDVTEVVVPTEALHQQRIMDAEVRTKAEKLINEGLLKPAKCTVKRDNRGE